jgi:hypothetical protein
MWMKFKCWWFGHKTMAMILTGEILKVNGVDIKLCRWERQKYCIRCGIEIV